MSVKRTVPFGLEHLPHGDYHPKTDHLNFAESSGAVHLHSLDEQFALMQTAKEQYPDFDESWKVLTLWMTANDVCGECQVDLNGTDYLNNWVSKTDELLTNLTQTTKNIYVNLMSTMDLSSVHRLQQSTLYCRELHEKVLKECGCLDRGNSTQLEMVDHNVHVMNSELHKLAQKHQLSLSESNRNDMAVVVQPFLEGVGPELGIEFLNDLDCFHPSTVGH